MTSDEFVRNIIATDILAAEDTVAILKSIAQPPGYTSQNADISECLSTVREPRPKLDIMVKYVSISQIDESNSSKK